MKSRYLPVFIMLVVFASAMSGCAQREVDPVNNPEEVTPSVLRVLIMTQPQSFDPAFAYDEVSRMVGMNIFSGLVRADETGAVEADLALEWVISGDGTVFTFTLREGALFHNGREVLAEDFAFSMNRLLAPSTNSPMARYLMDIKGAADVVSGNAEEAEGITVKGDYVLEIALVEPRPFFLANLSTPAGWVLPMEELGDEPSAWSRGKPIGSGPYKVQEVRHGDRIVLEPFDGYYGMKPQIDTLEMVVVEDPSVALFMYVEGELDYVPLQPQDVVEVRDEPDLNRELMEFPIASVFLLGLNRAGYEPFNDPRVRRAVSLALDREEFSHVVWRGTTTPAYGVFPPGMPGHRDMQSDTDMEKAKALMAEAGYGDGSSPPVLVITVPSTFIHKIMAEYFAHTFQEIGIPTDIELLEMGAFLERMYTTELPLLTVGWAADYLDPHNFLNALWHSQSPHNMVGYLDLEMDALLDEAARTMSPDDRLALYETAENKALEDGSWIPLFHGRQAVLVKPYVQGIRHNIMGLLPLDGVAIEPLK